MKKNKKPQDLSPYLRSVSLGFDDPDLVRDGVSNQLWRGGGGGEILAMSLYNS